MISFAGVPFVGVESPNLGDHSPYPFHQFLESLPFASFRLAERFLSLAFTPGRNERFAVQMEPTNVEHPGDGEPSQPAVFFLHQMRRKFISMWMQDPIRGIRSPKSSLEFVACVTAI